MEALNIYLPHKVRGKQVLTKEEKKRRRSVSNSTYRKRPDALASHRERGRIWALNNRAAKKQHGWKAKGINITCLEYDQMLVAQDYKCAICGIDETKMRKGLGVDHNHDTGQIRGLLCTNCNTALGLLQDSSTIVEDALKYLIHNGE